MIGVLSVVSASAVLWTCTSSGTCGTPSCPNNPALINGCNCKTCPTKYICQVPESGGSPYCDQWAYWDNCTTSIGTVSRCYAGPWGWVDCCVSTGATTQTSVACVACVAYS